MDQCSVIYISIDIVCLDQPILVDAHPFYLAFIPRLLWNRHQCNRAPFLDHALHVTPFY